jgi:uncharacterized membrane protein
MLISTAEKACRKEKKMTNTLSMRARLLVGAAAVALALALTGSVVAEDAHAKYKECPQLVTEVCL